jgi:hypothetical protein
VLAVLKNLQRLIDAGNDAEANKRRMEQIRQTYVGYLDPVTLVARAKLTLNRNNNSYYQDYLVPLGHLPQRGFRASEHLLRKAFEWFDRRVAEYLKKSTGSEGMRLAQFVEDMSDRLFFTVITVTDELNAYKVFETLNARGVRLSATDLLKNYLFSVLDRGSDTDHELRNLEERWEAMVGRLGAESFPDFLRAHWNSRRPLRARRNCSRRSAARSIREKWFFNSCAKWSKTSTPTLLCLRQKPPTGHRTSRDLPAPCGPSMFASPCRYCSRPGGFSMPRISPA